MSKDTLRTLDTAPSALDRLNLGFEYNITWAEEKKSVKERTI